jgi:hypothetical protein
MTTTFSPDESTALDAKIEATSPLAQAEAAYKAAHGPDEPNPWAGQIEKLGHLKTQRDQLTLQTKGFALSQALSDLKQIDTELQAATEAKEVKDHAVRVAAEHDAVRRWIAAPWLAMRLGVGHSLTAEFSPWFLSGRPRYAGAPSCVAYFMDHSNTNPGLRFSETDREPIRRHHEAKAAAEGALIRWCAIADRRARLLQSHPELRSI